MDETLPRIRSALLAFRARNNRSFRDEMEMSMLATAVAEPGVRRPVAWRAGGKPVDVLPVAGIFGPNASGKSNALRSMEDMRRLVLYSFRQARPSGGLSQRPFLLDPKARDAASSFEIDLILDGVRHEYGFVVDGKQVLEEWAVRYPRGRAVRLFDREGEHVQLGAPDRSRSRAVLDLLRPNALFLSTAASANHAVLLPLYEWFEHGLLLAEAQSRRYRQVLTMRLLEDGDTREQALGLLRAADLGITGAKKHPLDPAMKERLHELVAVLTGEDDDADERDVEDVFEHLDVRLAHRGAAEDVEFQLSEESLGTLVWFGLVGPVIAALSTGAVFLADELDASLHPGLVAELVSLFQDPQSNPHLAQLIFNSHDTTLMSDGTGARLIGRDQIWFTEKRVDGSTHLYPLTDLDPRRDEAIGKRYLAGRYGATPILSRRRFAQIAETITSGDPS